MSASALIPLAQVESGSRDEALLVSAVGGVCLLVAFVLYRRAKAFLARALRAEGTVIENVESRSTADSGTTYAPRVRFTRVDGRVVDFVHRMGHPQPRYKVGAVVPVIYDPDISGGAQIPGALSTWFFTGLFALIGSLMVLVGGILALVRG